MISFDQLICRDLGMALDREWLETNGRMVLLSKLEEVLIAGGKDLLNSRPTNIPA